MLHVEFPEESVLCLSSNGDLNFHSGFDIDNDLFDDLGRRVEATASLLFAHSSYWIR